MRTLRFWWVLLLCPACASWEETRRDVVQPVQRLLHHEYPAALETMSLPLLSALYSDPSTAPESARSWESFASIERATARIVDAELGVARATALVEVRLEGMDASGVPVMTEQLRSMACVAREGRWAISTDHGESSIQLPVPDTTFVDETGLRGVDFVHTPPYLPDSKGQPQRFVLGAGAAVADIDGDGWEDIVLASARTITAYRNRPPDENDGLRGHFELATGRWGLDGEHAMALTCTLLFDFDNDGDQDLYLGAHLDQPILFRNDATPSGPRFVRLEESGIIVSSQRAITACAADFDGDGWLDLYVANNQDPYHQAPSPLGVARNAHADQLFLNNRDGTFQDVTEIAGVGNTGWSLVCTTADYDQDGDIDLFVGNDFGLDVLFRNDGVGADGIPRFSEVASESGAAEPIASMSADWGDFDGDGDFDLFVGGMSSNTDWVVDQPSFPSPVPWLLDTLFRDRVRAEIREFFHGNRFYENLGDATFREVSMVTETHNSLWAWGTCWLDFDNDGRLDIYGANGFLSGPEREDL